MHHRIQLILLGCLLYTLAGCGGGGGGGNNPPGAQPATTLRSYKNNDRWDYTFTGSVQQGSSVQNFSGKAVFYVEEGQFDGAPVLLLNQGLSFDGIGQELPRQVFALRQENGTGDLTILADNGGEYGTARKATQPGVLYPGRWRADLNLNSRIRYNTGGEEQITLKVTGAEKVTVPQGTFSCWKTEITTTDADGTLQSEEWWAPEAGVPVKFTLRWQDSDGAKYTLTAILQKMGLDGTNRDGTPGCHDTPTSDYSWFGTEVTTTGNPADDALIRREFDQQVEFFGLSANNIRYRLFREYADNALAAYDGQILLGLNLLENIRSQFGEEAAAGVIAHEMAHQFQFVNFPELSIGLTKWQELEADAFAGFYLAYKEGLTEQKVVGFIESIASGGDYNFNSPDHHGTPHERRYAASMGYITAQQHKVNQYTIEELHNIFYPLLVPPPPPGSRAADRYLLTRNVDFAKVERARKRVEQELIKRGYRPPKR